ncbi:MAG: PIG-L family deacetylase [Candidatus Omnitrophica bacterium]|jgi:LmbE family N-acetylglucosaminyl deacetylase|nr:PIG-L family deacetylase [Candidatus Omnitrophota bacterium]
MNKTKNILIFFLFFAICIIPACFAQLEFSSADRVLILAPHPDDEIIASGGIIQKALKGNSKVKIVYLTSGEYNEISYFFYKRNPAISRHGFINIGETRQKEAYNAAAFLGVAKKDLVFLGYPDRFTEAILASFWDEKWPAASMLTHIGHVPYKNALSYGAPYVGQSITKDLKQVLSDFKPTKIFVSSPYDANLDHRSLYVFTTVALLDLKEKIGEPPVYTYLIHKIGWPKVKKYLPSFELDPPSDFINGDAAWSKVYLSDEEIINKRKALAFYRSQLSFAKNYLLSFVRRNELLCLYPEINFDKEKIPKVLQVNSKLISKIAYSKDRDFLYINISLNRKIAKGLKADIYLLGYNNAKDFSLMPKIFFKAKDHMVIAYEGRKRIFIDGIKINSKEDLVSIIVPLRALDNPDYIFSRIILKGKLLAVYAGGWQVIEL